MTQTTGRLPFTTADVREQCAQWGDAPMAYPLPVKDLLAMCRAIDELRAQLRFRCPRCGEYADFQITDVRLDQDLIDTSTLRDGRTDPQYVLGPLRADIEATSGHTC